LKARYLDIATAVEGPFESKVVDVHITVAVRGSFKGRVLNYDVVGNNLKGL